MKEYIKHAQEAQQRLADFDARTPRDFDSIDGAFARLLTGKHRMRIPTDPSDDDIVMAAALKELFEGRAEIARLREALASIRDGVSDGCADGSCAIRKPEGMHTNGGCRCVKERDVQRLQLAILASRRVARAALEET